ncbi:MAG: siderophore-interacting protein [Acidimicrobiia bacterium]
MSEKIGVAGRIRREPPSFRRVAVRSNVALTPHMRRVTLSGADLAGMVIDQPAASVRLLLPSPGTDELVIPTWNGNEFLLPDGARPALRTFTPRRFDPTTLELDLDIVIHHSGIATDWAQRAVTGMPAAISGPARGYAVDERCRSFVLLGDEPAIPAMAQLLEVIDHHAQVIVHVELTRPDARPDLPDHRGATIIFHEVPATGRHGERLVDALAAMSISPETKIWAAGEAAAVQRIRTLLFTERGVPRTQATVRGYWKHGHGGDESDEN